MRHVDTLSTIYRYIFHSKSPTKSLFVEKKRSKVGPMLSRKFQITYKIIVCGEKMVKISTILSRKSLKCPSWLAMCNVYIRNELPTRLPVRFNAIQHRGDILPIRTCGDFYVSFCINIAMSNRHVVSLGEYSDNREFRQSITALRQVKWSVKVITINSITTNPLNFLQYLKK